MEGFEVELDREFDPGSFSGFLPCPDENAGFEYSIGSLASELPAMRLRPEQQRQLAGVDALVEFNFRTEADLRVAQAASSVLATITAGYVLDGESGGLMSAEQSLAWARGAYVPKEEISVAAPPKSKQKWSALRIMRLVLFGALIVWLGYQWAIK
jgi:hypothetical protein